jgi:hypothetical protein
MSESERQQVQARVRAAMDAQVVNGVATKAAGSRMDMWLSTSGPHRNPRKAAEGFRLRVLAIRVDVKMRVTGWDMNPHARNQQVR